MEISIVHCTINITKIWYFYHYYYYHYYYYLYYTIIIILSLLLPLLLPLLLASIPYYLLNLRGAIKLSEPIYFDKNEWIKLVKQRKQNSLNAEWNNQLL